MARKKKGSETANAHCANLNANALDQSCGTSEGVGGGPGPVFVGRGSLCLVIWWFVGRQWVADWIVLAFFSIVEIGIISEV